MLDKIKQRLKTYKFKSLSEKKAVIAFVGPVVKYGEKQKADSLKRLKKSIKVAKKIAKKENKELKELIKKWEKDLK